MRNILRFIKIEMNAGIVLIIVTIAAMIIANSPLSKFYFDFFENTKITIDFKIWSLSKPLYYWINDGLMAIFFLLVGLEIKREIVIGELSNMKKALFPIVAAVGGMLIPALIFSGVNIGHPESANGWAIPMATDIAFALAIIAILKSKVPVELKIFLTSLAIVDDLGAVLTIAIFYTSEISFDFLFTALGAWVFLIVLNRLKVRNFWIYLIIGVVLIWYPLLKSGVHATIAGILIAFAIPMERKFSSKQFIRKTQKVLDEFAESSESENCYKLNSDQYEKIDTIQIYCNKASSPLQQLENLLHNGTLYVIMPLFAFANTGIEFSEFKFSEFFSNQLAIGVFLGLVLGKAIGISLFVFIFNKLKIISIPSNINKLHIIGAGFLAGIGFTMSIFITELAFFGKPDLIVVSKVAVLFASVCSGLIGYILISRASKKGEFADEVFNEDISGEE